MVGGSAMQVEHGSGNSEKLSTMEMFGTPRYHENIADPSATTGGKPPLTQWVHGGFIVVSGSKCPALTHQVHFDHFCNLLCNSPCKNPVGTG